MENEKINKLGQTADEQSQGQHIYAEISDEDLNQAIRRSNEAHARLSKQWDVLNVSFHRYWANEGQKRLDELLSIQAKYQHEHEILAETLRVKKERKEELNQIISDRQSKNRKIKEQIEDFKTILAEKEDKIAFQDEYEKAVLLAKEKKDVEFDERMLELDARERELRDRDFCVRDKVEALKQRKEAFQVRMKERREKLDEMRTLLEGDTNKRIINCKRLFNCRRGNSQDDYDKSQQSLSTAIEPTLNTTSKHSQSNQPERTKLSHKSKMSAFMSRFRRGSRNLHEPEPSTHSTSQAGCSAFLIQAPVAETVDIIKPSHRHMLASKLKGKFKSLSSQKQNGSNPIQV